MGFFFNDDGDGKFFLVPFALSLSSRETQDVTSEHIWMQGYSQREPQKNREAETVVRRERKKKTIARKEMASREKKEKKVASKKKTQFSTSVGEEKEEEKQNFFLSVLYPFLFETMAGGDNRCLNRVMTGVGVGGALGASIGEKKKRQ